MSKHGTRQRHIRAVDSPREWGINRPTLVFTLTAADQGVRWGRFWQRSGYAFVDQLRPASVPNAFPKRRRAACVALGSDLTVSPAPPTELLGTRPTPNSARNIPWATRPGMQHIPPDPALPRL
ncbi:hypothetical protein DPEC_G00271830 [Dallia pectoralis]|uniref:Uncharacterized protein n=1 Tax=Dallia pectoralis TaxID=75939 RepID=A0ACC2FPV3_DALPE|nr:hypothetical protein DPEC_G00271830 [Dallia pectoralis]